MDQIDHLCQQMPNIISAQTEKDTFVETKEIYEILNKEKNNSPSRDVEFKLTRVNFLLTQIISKLHHRDRDINLLGQDLHEKGEQYTGYHLKHYILQKMYMLYKRSGIDHSLQGPGFIWGDPSCNGFVFHKDFEFDKVNRVQSLIL